MKVSLSWLQDYLSINLPVPKLAEKMTDLGLECTFESSEISFSNIVLGSIISCKPSQF